MPKGTPGKPVCSIEGCGQLNEARGYCKKHYQRWRTTGDPIKTLYGDPSSRFWDKVDKNGSIPACRPELGQCWEWTARTVNGYGSFVPCAGRSVLAHRYVYELAGVTIPDSLEPDHLCRNRPCVRITHLELVTHRENILRGESPPAINARKTHCSRGHLFDSENTYVEKKNGWRQCRECRRIRDAAP
jgi:hypothetical protein